MNGFIIAKTLLPLHKRRLYIWVSTDGIRYIYILCSSIKNEGAAYGNVEHILMLTKGVCGLHSVTFAI